MITKQLDINEQITLAHSSVDAASKRLHYTITAAQAGDKTDLMREAQVLLLKAKGKLETALLETE